MCIYFLVDAVSHCENLFTCFTWFSHSNHLIIPVSWMRKIEARRVSITTQGSNLWAGAPLRCPLCPELADGEQAVRWNRCWVSSKSPSLVFWYPGCRDLQGVRVMRTSLGWVRFNSVCVNIPTVIYFGKSLLSCDLMQRVFQKHNPGRPWCEDRFFPNLDV